VRTRPVMATAAAVALLGGAAVPALAAVGDPADRPAAGAATSTLTLLDVALGGKSLSVLELALRSDTLSGAPATSFVVTPLTMDGTAYGRQSLSSRSAVLPAVDSTSSAPAALSAVATARSPLVDVRSEGGTSSAGTPSLGAFSVLGMPLALSGTASISSVVDTGGAAGGKTLKVTGLALPSVADLVAALGLDLTALPPASLTDLLDGLDLGSTSIEQLQAELDAALASVQPQVDAAEERVAGAGDAVQAADAQLAAAEAALASATTTLNDATRALTGTVAGQSIGRLVALNLLVPILDAPVPVVEETVPVLDPILETVTVTEPLPPVVDVVTEPVEVLPLPEVTIVPGLQPLLDAYDAAKKAYDDAVTTVEAAKTTVATAATLLSDAGATLDALLATAKVQADALVSAVVSVLDATPLVSLDRLEVTTRSAVTSAQADGQSAQVVGGEVENLRVLGTDVLASTVGSSSVDVLDLTGPVKAQVDAAVTGLTGTLSSVLSAVPGLPGLNVPAPKVDLLTRATVTDVVDGYGVAGTALRALTVSWPGITVPAAVALPGAAALPSVTGLPTLPALGVAGSTSFATSSLTAAGDVLTQPLTLSIATLEDRARFRPAQLSLVPEDGAPGIETPGIETPGTGTPGTGTPGTGTPGTGTPGTGTPGTGTPGTGTPGTGTPDTGTGGPGTTSPDVPAGGSTPPGTTTANPRSTPVGLTQLPRTGTDSTPAAVALLLLGAALALHRRIRTA